MKISPQVFVSNLSSEIWAMEPVHLGRFITSINEGVVAVDNETIKAAKDGDSDADDKAYKVSGGVATIQIKGTILKDVPCVFRWFGMSATSTTKTQAAIAKANGDKDVSEIVFEIDSPGGTVSGLQELAEDIKGSEKPTKATISDLCCSAAYWIASQCDCIESNRTAKVGSIGVYTTVVDSSEQAKERGIKVHIIKSGEIKGMGEPGVPISKEQLASRQELVDDIANIFIESVAQGRGMNESKVRELATGQSWLAEKAQDRGLIDSVLLSGNLSKVDTAPNAPTSATKGTAMADNSTLPASTGAKNDETEAALRLASDAEARANAAEAQAANDQKELKLMKESRCKDHIDAGQKDGRIMPTQLAGVEDYANLTGHDSEKVKAFISSLPVQSRPEPSLDASEDPNLKAEKPATAEEIGIAKTCGVTVEQLRTLGSDDVEGVTFDNMLCTYSGSVEGEPIDSSLKSVYVN